MVPNRNEPATKFFGPNYPFVKSIDPSRVHVQLHNLKPGQFWNPALKTLIHKKQVLLPQPGAATWLAINFPFAWGWSYRPDRIDLLVIHIPGLIPVFTIHLHFIQTRWMLNEIIKPLGNYALRGTATLAWKDVPRS